MNPFMWFFTLLKERAVAQSLRFPFVYSLKCLYNLVVAIILVAKFRNHFPPDRYFVRKFPAFQVEC